MKDNLIQFGKVSGIAIVLLTASVSYGAPGTGAATDKKEDSAPPVRRSVFEDDSRTGKDPFFPNSTRRSAQLPSSPEEIEVPDVQLSLKGISGPANRRFALINNQPLGVGESALVRVPGGQVKVHCWEIREDSVIVSVAGDPERKQLKLRDGL